ncbi:MAG: PilC/PilY family type IV pilus protein, partial [Gammaproteobacteria bacterium]|nr:PilC/PilY family type IV pilus protein [Gammaproteobacteria bacterium]
MKIWMKKIKLCITALSLTMVVSTPVVAEDIEIYLQNNVGTSKINPNIMFVLDTSGSMGKALMLNETYDPLVNYSLRTDPATGKKGCFDPNRMYHSTTSDVSCISAFTQNYYLMAQNNCQRLIDGFASVGSYTATFAQYNINTNSWGQLKDKVKTQKVIECDVDQGIHGDGGVEMYIDITGSGSPYTTNTAGASTSWGSLATDTLTFYSGNWMNYKITSVGVVSTRLEVMRDVIINLLYGIDGVNVGLMKFDKYNGGPVIYEMQDVTASRNNMVAEMNTWSPQLYTPLSETLYEAFLYFSGGLIDYGNTSIPKSVGGSKLLGEPKHYASPVDPKFAECQKQFLIMLTDGAPTHDTGADAKIEALPGFEGTDGGSDCFGTGNGACLDDLAGYMNKHGFDAYLGASEPGIKDVQLNTYTIGFADDVNADPAAVKLLSDTAKQGGGSFFVAHNQSDLLNTLQEIIREIKGIDTTFSSPAVSVNAFNRSRHREELYFSLFKPSVKNHWDGNLKRYKLAFDLNGDPIIEDANGNNAVNLTTGFFKDTATSFWTTGPDAPDGKDAELGGAASMLTNNRNVYTVFGGKGSVLTASNQVHENNANMSLATLGIPMQTAAYRDTLLQWARGIDVKDDDGDGALTDARRYMGDPLHGQPALIPYGGTEANPDITAYSVTNDGYLHAIDAGTGKELFAFIPEDLLPNLDILYRNSNKNKTYGLDGSIESVVIDNNRNGVIETVDNDKVYLFFGMRRGGRNYYAMDVTNRNAPELLWTIKGGTNDPAMGDYTELGQSWSKPEISKIRVKGADQLVLWFAAGYDTIQDGVVVRTPDTMGRGLFLVDAMTGKRLFHIGTGLKADLSLADMIYSMPSDLMTADYNGDKYLDRIYVGDMGGQVWRVDIAKGDGASDSYKDIISAGRIADLAGDTIETNRRLYYPPEAALMKATDNSLYVALAVISGYRSHPTNRVIHDRAFMLRDVPVYEAPGTGLPADYVTLTESDLFDTTDNIIGDGTVAQKDTAIATLSKAKGWFIDLNYKTGEKGLTRALIANKRIYF